MSSRVKGFKLSDDLIEKYTQIRDHSGEHTDSQFFEILLNEYMHSDKPALVPVAPDTSLNEKILQLESELSNYEQELQSLKEQNNNLQYTLIQTEANLAKEKERTTPRADTPDENQIILKPNPVMIDLIDRCALKASQRTGRDFNRERILLNLFWEAATQGRASLPIIFSSSEIESTIKKHKQS